MGEVIAIDRAWEIFTLKRGKFLSHNACINRNVIYTFPPYRLNRTLYPPRKTIGVKSSHWGQIPERRVVVLPGELRDLIATYRMCVCYFRNVGDPSPRCAKIAPVNIYRESIFVASGLIVEKAAQFLAT